MDINFEDITLRCTASYRGGGIEIDLTSLGFEGEKMSAYQNYLGGGMLASIQCNDTLTMKGRPPLDEGKLVELVRIREALMRYFHSLTNHSDDEWETTTFEQCQLRPKSYFNQ